MDWLFDFTWQQLCVFILVLARVSALVLSVPWFAGSAAPLRLRVILAVALAVLATPSQIAAAVDAPASLTGQCVMIGGEIVIGYSLGLGITILFSGAQLAGQVVGQMTGMTLANVYEPAADAETPFLSQLFYMVALAVFFLAGGHRMLMSGLLDSFEALRPGVAGLDISLAEMLVTLLAQSFSLGIRLAAPATAALLLASLVLGAVSRTLPQLNSMSLGLSLNALTTLCMLTLSMGAMAWAFQDEFEPAVQAIVEGVAAMNR